MAKEVQHQMVVKNTYPTGVQEYYCPTCGRHFILQWPPEYKRIILNEGDLDAVHTGSTGGLVMDHAEVDQAKTPPDDLHSGGADTGGIDDDTLAPWMRWFNSREE